MSNNRFILKSLIFHSAYIGIKPHKHNKLLNRFIYKTESPREIVNLNMTLFNLKRLLSLVRLISKNKGRILVISNDKVNTKLAKFKHISIWKHGLLTNSKTIRIPIAHKVIAIDNLTNSAIIESIHNETNKLLIPYTAFISTSTPYKQMMYRIITNTNNKHLRFFYLELINYVIILSKYSKFLKLKTS